MSLNRLHYTFSRTLGSSIPLHSSLSLPQTQVDTYSQAAAGLLSTFIHSSRYISGEFSREVSAKLQREFQQDTSRHSQGYQETGGDTILKTVKPHRSSFDRARKFQSFSRSYRRFAAAQPFRSIGLFQPSWHINFSGSPSGSSSIADRPSAKSARAIH